MPAGHAAPLSTARAAACPHSAADGNALAQRQRRCAGIPIPGRINSASGSSAYTRRNAVKTLLFTANARRCLRLARASRQAVAAGSPCRSLLPSPAMHPQSAAHIHLRDHHHAAAASAPFFAPTALTPPPRMPARSAKSTRQHSAKYPQITLQRLLTPPHTSRVCSAPIG